MSGVGFQNLMGLSIFGQVVKGGPSDPRSSKGPGLDSPLAPFLVKEARADQGAARGQSQPKMSGVGLQNVSQKCQA